MTTAELTQSAVRALAPYLLLAAAKLAEGAGGEAGKAVAAAAGRQLGALYDWVRGVLFETEEGARALEAASAKPEASELLVLEGELSRALDASPDRATELQSLLRELPPQAVSGSVVTNVHGDVGKVTTVGTVMGDLTIN